MIRPTPLHTSTLLVPLLMAVQFALTLAHAAYPLVGDEFYWVSKAQHLVTHGTLAPIDRAALEVERGSRHGNSDWRPQAYGVFVAACSLGDFTAAGSSLRRRVVGVQFLLLSAALMALHHIVGKAMSRRGRWAAAALFGGTPWLFEFADSIGDGPLNAAVMTAALVILWRWVSDRKTTPPTLFAGALLASSTLLIRPEMIVSGPLAIAFAFILRKPAAKDVGVIALAFAIPLFAQVAYRTWAVGEPSIYGGLHIVNRGAFRWVSTWAGSEKEGYDFVYAITGANAIPLPQRAFSDPSEEQTVNAIVTRVVRRGRYTEHDDADFERLATQRWRRRPIFTTALRGWHAIHLWVNTENPTYVTASLRSLSRDTRRPIYALLLVLKLGCISAACAAAARAFAAAARRRATTLDGLTLFLISFVIARTLLIGLLLNWKVHRYMLVAWPPLVACAAMALLPIGPREPAEYRAPVGSGFTI